MLSLGLAIVIGGTVALCIGFLVVLILFGVKRYFAAGSTATEKQRNVEVGATGAEEKQEMEWDNSALNIIINPLDDLDDDQMQIGAVAAAAGVGRDADADSDDECNFDGCDASDEEKEMPRCSKELEWDNSTLTF
jgi:calsyntenin 1